MNLIPKIKKSKTKTYLHECIIITMMVTMMVAAMDYDLGKKCRMSGKSHVYSSAQVTNCL